MNQQLLVDCVAQRVMIQGTATRKIQLKEGTRSNLLCKSTPKPPGRILGNYNVGDVVEIIPLGIAGAKMKVKNKLYIIGTTASAAQEGSDDDKTIRWNGETQETEYHPNSRPSQTLRRSERIQRNRAMSTDS